MTEKDKKDSLVEMFVAGILLDPATQAPVIVLKGLSDEKMQLPIWIGMAEATSIASKLKKLVLNRPLTHDLLLTLVEELDASVEQAVITGLKDSTYFAELAVSAGERAIILDCRPSDAIAMALRANAPIYVSSEVLEQAKETVLPPERASLTAEDSQGDGTREKKIDDLRYVDKSKWAEILKDLDVDDFKYKA